MGELRDYTITAGELADRFREIAGRAADGGHVTLTVQSHVAMLRMKDVQEAIANADKQLSHAASLIRMLERDLKLVRREEPRPMRQEPLFTEENKGTEAKQEVPSMLARLRGDLNNPKGTRFLIGESGKEYWEGHLFSAPEVIDVMHGTISQSQWDKGVRRKSPGFPQPTDGKKNKRRYFFDDVYRFHAARNVIPQIDRRRNKEAS